MYKYVVVYPTSFLTSILMLQATTTKERSQLNTRLSFHLSHKFSDEKKLMSFHQEARFLRTAHPGTKHLRI